MSEVLCSVAIGHDVGDVRVHTDAKAGELAGRIQASAFTVGRDMFFAGGQYRPDTDAGMHTLLHESGHLLERGGDVRRSTIRRKISVTVAQLDGSFKHSTGLTGLRKSLSSDEIPKLREALKAYHANAEGGLDNDEKMAAIQKLRMLSEQWLKKHSKIWDAKQSAGADVVGSINAEAGVEYAKLHGEAKYMGDAGAAGKSAQERPTSGPGAHPLGKLKEEGGFGRFLYDRRADTEKQGSLGGRATRAREALVGAGELKKMDPAQQAAVTAGIESLSPAEFAAVHVYTGKDYEYMNPNVGGWGAGVGDMKQRPYDPADPKNKNDSAEERERKVATEKKRAPAKEAYEEAGLHAGFIASACASCPCGRAPRTRASRWTRTISV